jgi:hypothetical protein
MNQNKTTKYFKYAIGEIILVVIGILIALQINNWNHTNKNDKLKSSYITALIADYTKDTIDLSKGMATNKVIIQEIDSLNQILYSDDVELVDFINNFKNFNRNVRVDNTYNSNSFTVLIESGDFSLLEKDLADALTELNRLQKYEKEVSENNGHAYMALLTNSITEFPIISAIETYSERSKELIWNGVDVEKIPFLITNILNYKKYVSTRYMSLSEDVKTQTEKVLKLLYSKS